MFIFVCHKVWGWFLWSITMAITEWQKQNSSFLEVRRGTAGSSRCICPTQNFCAEWQEQKPLEGQGSLTPSQLTGARKPGIFSDDSPTPLDWFPPVCFADFVSTLVKKRNIIESEESGTLKSKLSLLKSSWNPAIRKTKKMQRQNCEGDRICFQILLQLKLPFLCFPLPLSRSLSQASRNQDVSPPHSHIQNMPRHESCVSRLNLGLNLNLYYSS